MQLEAVSESKALRSLFRRESVLTRGPRLPVRRERNLPGPEAFSRGTKDCDGQAGGSAEFRVASSGHEQPSPAPLAKKNK
jgi:hypothetical protein